MSFFLFWSFWATPTACGRSQARGQIRAAAAGLCHNHSNAGSKPCLRPTPQLAAMLGPSSTERGQGLNLHPHRDNARSLTHWATTGTPESIKFWHEESNGNWGLSSQRDLNDLSESKKCKVQEKQQRTLTSNPWVGRWNKCALVKSRECGPRGNFSEAMGCLLYRQVHRVPAAVRGRLQHCILDGAFPAL